VKAFILLALGCIAAVNSHGEVRLPIGAGDFASVLRDGDAQALTHVDAFSLDRRPITNAEFLAFTIKHSEWRRDRVPSLFADGDYLSHWTSPGSLGATAQPRQPITRVSWFAARAYCEAAGGRLPDWNEWELVAAADETIADARHDPAWRELILTWYGQPASRVLSQVAMGRANFYGVQDLHGLVWEWVEDFNALLVSADSRDQNDPDKLKFCGAGAASLKDRENYAVLMRIAFLSALEARSTARSLGFRCAAGGSP
jgi:formylglycine-generating enzyme